MFVILSNLVNENITFIFSFHISFHHIIRYNPRFLLKHLIYLIIQVTSISHKQFKPLIQRLDLKCEVVFQALDFLLILEINRVKMPVILDGLFELKLI